MATFARNTPWAAVVDDATGRLLSTGQVVGKALPRGAVVVSLPHAPDWHVHEWDVKARTLVPRQPNEEEIAKAAVIRG